MGATALKPNILGVNETEKDFGRRFDQLPFTIQSDASPPYPQRELQRSEDAPFTDRRRIAQCAEHSFRVANKGSAIVSVLIVSYRTVP